MTSIPEMTSRWLANQIPGDFTVARPLFSDRDDVYRLEASDEVYFLKVADDLGAEHKNLLSLQSFLIVPEVVCYERIGDKDYLLTKEVPGKNLAELSKQSDAHVVAREFARAVKKFHELDVLKILPDKASDGLVVLHGDISLPNIISVGSGLFGYIDLGQMSVGLPEADLSDAIWSLQRNLGPGYGKIFLDEYGDVDITEKLQQALDFRYDQS